MSETESTVQAKVELPQKGFMFSATTDRKRAPEGSDKRYDYDRIEVTVSGSAESYDELKKMVQSAVSLGATTARVTIDKLQGRVTPPEATPQ